MKAQNTTKLAKKTVFVFKSAKNQNNFNTDPTTATAKTILTFDIYDISFRK
ncbi:hypothetical protein [Pedobacter punctiformis]|uniref:Uncharacterized protein n=1 Tax=Pedobacter punctiformis TaxID=3004097 RepID=A0ABT4LBE4_9SPHI|nr:hypothetical protein [Pedobacter sp. HCMS5-2]MCZ4245235.1 hypothetical protein [Pedobacter sp. HCMS5-2]